MGLAISTLVSQALGYVATRCPMQHAGLPLRSVLSRAFEAFFQIDRLVASIILRTEIFIVRSSSLFWESAGVIWNRRGDIISHESPQRQLFSTCSAQKFLRLGVSSSFSFRMIVAIALK